ncbi:MAG: NTP transferase domain-containing protein [Bdellovibrionales bacterium]|nr:NTP transferase domain-containing protein [Bdellovibrionales bacterium]
MKKAMILAAGRGTRLGALGKDKPKALLQVGHVCLLQHVIGRLISIGIESIVINLHHHGDQIKQFIKAHDSFGIEIFFSEEPVLLETGGAVKNAAEYFEGEDEFIVHNADIYSEIDLSAVLDAHRVSSADATLVVNQRGSSRTLLFDAQQYLVGWRNKVTEDELVLAAGTVDLSLSFCGIQIISSKLLQALATYDADCFSIITAYIELAKAGFHIRPCIVDGSPWFDVGTPEKVASLERYLSTLSNLV